MTLDHQVLHSPGSPHLRGKGQVPSPPQNPRVGRSVAARGKATAEPETFVAPPSTFLREPTREVDHPHARTHARMQPKKAHRKQTNYRCPKGERC